jgi:hypothetical protein
VSLAKLYAQSLAVRALVIAAAVGWLAVILLGAALWVQSSRHETASNSLATAESARDAARASANNWEATAGDLQKRLDTEIRERAADRQRDEAAVIAAEAAQRDADRTLRAWLDRYAAATRSAECAAIERMPICEVPR